MFTDIINSIVFHSAKNIAKSCYVTADALRLTADKLDATGDKLVVKADEMNKLPTTNNK